MSVGIATVELTLMKILGKMKPITLPTGTDSVPRTVASPLSVTGNHRVTRREVAFIKQGCAKAIGIVMTNATTKL